MKKSKRNSSNITLDEYEQEISMELNLGSR